MRWNRRYVLKSYIRGALWIVPFFAVVAYLVFARIAEALNRWLVLSGRIDETTAFHGLTTAEHRRCSRRWSRRASSFLVFTFGSLLVAIEVRARCTSTGGIVSDNTCSRTTRILFSIKVSLVFRPAVRGRGCR